MSTRVLLATLSIPITPERTDIARLLDMDGIIVEKQRRLATLLGLQSPPNRVGLINDMVRMFYWLLISEGNLFLQRGTVFDSVWWGDSYVLGAV